MPCQHRIKLQEAPHGPELASPSDLTSCHTFHSLAGLTSPSLMGFPFCSSSVQADFHLLLHCWPTAHHQSGATRNKGHYRAVTQSTGRECGFGAENEEPALLCVSPAERLLSHTKRWTDLFGLKEAQARWSQACWSWTQHWFPFSLVLSNGKEEPSRLQANRLPLGYLAH